jgi:hypothetical protein
MRDTGSLADIGVDFSLRILLCTGKRKVALLKQQGYKYHKRYGRDANPTHEPIL